MAAFVRSFTTEHSHLKLIDMQRSHLDALYRLSVSVGWPHRRDDWSSNLEIGQGIVAIDALDRVHGSAMFFPYENGPAAVGMVICHPRLGRSSLKPILVREIIERAGGSSTFLNACHDDIGVFRREKAKSVSGVFKFQGYLAADIPHEPTCRTIVPTDYPRILELDHEVYAADRGTLLKSLLSRSEGRVVERSGRIVAFALCRPFGRGLLIGPVAAEKEADAITLVAALISGRIGQFIRVDTRLSQGHFVTFLRALGLRPSLAVTTMTLNSLAPGLRPPAYALSGHSTG